MCVLNLFRTGLDIDIKIEIQIIENRLRLLVENSFDHLLKVDDNLTESGIGLENVKKRLSLLYPKKHQLKTKRMNNKFVVDMTIELHYE